MSEITKLYENAGINKREIENCTYKNSTPCGHICDDGEDCPYLEIKEDYPPFTAKKQIELIKWLAFRDYISIVAYISGEYHSEHDKYNANENSLEDCLARLVNTLWQDLTEAEKQQVKGILE